MAFQHIGDIRVAARVFGQVLQQGLMMHLLHRCKGNRVYKRGHAAAGFLQGDDAIAVSFAEREDLFFRRAVTIPAQQLVRGPGHVEQMVDARPAALMVAVHPAGRIGKNKNRGKQSLILRRLQHQIAGLHGFVLPLFPVQLLPPKIQTERGAQAVEPRAEPDIIAIRAVQANGADGFLVESALGPAFLQYGRVDAFCILGHIRPIVGCGQLARTGFSPEMASRPAHRFRRLGLSRYPKIITVMQGLAGDRLSFLLKVDVTAYALSNQSGMEQRSLLLPQQVHRRRDRLLLGDGGYVTDERCGHGFELRDQGRTAHHMSTDDICRRRHQVR